MTADQRQDAPSALPRRVGSRILPPRQRIATIGTPQTPVTPGATSLRRATSAAGATPNGPLGGYRIKAPRTEDVRAGKRTLSAAGIGATAAEFTTPQPAKRALVSSARPESPRSPTSRELELLRAEYDRRVQGDQSAYKALELQMRAQARELEALKCQRVEVLREWEAERAAEQRRHDEWAATRAHLEEQLVALRSETLQLRASRDELSVGQSQSSSAAQTRVSEMSVRLVQLEARADEAEAQNKVLQKSNAALRAEIAELNAAPRPAATQAPDLGDQLSQQIAAVERLEARNALLESENTRLAEASARTEILREANRSLEAKAKRLEALQDGLLQAESEIASLKGEKDAWDKLLRGGIETDERAAFVAAANSQEDVEMPELTRATLPTYISQLRGTIMGLKARIVGLNQSIEELRAANVALGRRTEQGTEKENQLEHEMNSMREAHARLQRAYTVQTDELQRANALIDSFESEAMQGQSYDATQAQRIKGLEESLAAARQENAALAQKAHTIEHPQAAADPEELAAARHAAEEQAAQVAALEKQLEQLGEENAQLWTRVGRGEYDPSRERCLVLADNPVSRDYAIRSATLEALRKENQELLAQVESLHAAAAPSGAGVAQATASQNQSSEHTDPDAALVPIQTVENMRAEIERLQETIRARDKGLLRLKQVFTAKANEFREAVQSLFGYKLRFLENGKVKITSAYARGARSTTLVFRSEEGNVGQMKLQGEAVDGLANVAHLRDYWLSDGIRHSVPCFLAALNLELYENTTQAIRGSFGGADGVEE
ncbi:[phosphatase 2A protein]-leucine-carboxy methyltransferase [Malassezia cuniculi]|uniref:Spindle assembly checkpoint component MAD1 n=1 Tax=Malassezia cuniculi TaxID=948313 RepID=A0AAF0J5P5_9BASI|nr:[phosphatase 2A protein]-leucine-carboxy methyltransferase [Malassezia cuniculi]